MGDRASFQGHTIETEVLERPEVVAMVCTWRGTARSEQVWMAGTLPEHHRQGYASALLSAVCGQLFSRSPSGCGGKEVVSLIASEDNLPARALYTDLGFELICGHNSYTVAAAPAPVPEAAGGKL